MRAAQTVATSASDALIAATSTQTVTRSKPALAILGGSTVAAIVVGLLYGRNKRVWCRYLCPVNGVFAVLAKLAPVSFQVDHAGWAASPKPRGDTFNCAPLVPVKTMTGAGACHMCGRCSGYRGAVRLARRSPTHEIVHVAGTEPSLDQTVLILFGMMGLAVGAFGGVPGGVFLGGMSLSGVFLGAVRIVEAGE